MFPWNFLIKKMYRKDLSISLKKVKEKLRDTPKQENVIITVKELKRAIARMSNCKAAGPDHVQGFRFKKATGLHTNSNNIHKSV